MSAPADSVSVLPVTGLGEIRAGDDLPMLLRGSTTLTDGDILVVTSKVVSKAEGRVLEAVREAVLEDETDRVLARRGGTAIVRTRQGLVLAAAGIDASNTEPGTIVLLPVDPDASARALRTGIGADAGPNVAVVVSDTLGRPWRNGQTDMAIGAAGIEVLQRLGGTPDGYGNHLEVTEPAIADEIASAADLVKGKLSRSPAAVLRGLGHLVNPPGDHGSGAQALVRDERSDMFGHGAREAVLRALGQQWSDLRGFGRAAAAPELVETLRGLSPLAEFDQPGSGGTVDVLLPTGPEPDAQRRLGADEARLSAAAFALGWLSAGRTEPEEPAGVRLRFAPHTP